MIPVMLMVEPMDPTALRHHTRYDGVPELWSTYQYHQAYKTFRVMCYVLGRYSFIPVLHLEIILRGDIHHEKKSYPVLRIVVQSSTAADYSGKKRNKTTYAKI